MATDVRRAINAIPLAHQVEPQDELIDNLRDEYICSQNWKDLRWQKRVADLNKGSCTVFTLISHEIVERQKKKPETRAMSMLACIITFDVVMMVLIN